MRNKLSFLITLGILLALTTNIYALTNDYEGLPPFIVKNIKANVVIMLDNSGSMKTSMYANYESNPCDSNFSVYNPNKNYFGMFDSNENYEYDNAIPVNTSAYSVTVDENQTGAFKVSSCTISIGGDCWNGNFLNFITTRRIDAAREVLIGGKAENRAGYDYDSDGNNEWKIIGNNEPSDRYICSKQNGTVSPYPSDTVFQVFSPHQDGNSTPPYSPYAKIIPIVSTTTSISFGGTTIGEFGKISDLDHNVTHVNFKNNYTTRDPIVVAGPLSYNGSDPSTVRITNVTSSGFDIKVEEWDYLDVSHTTEDLYYLVVEEGSYALPSGERIKAGKLEIGTNNENEFTPISFSRSFSTKPVILTSVASNNDSDTVVARLSDITSSGFDITLQEQESYDGVHSEETINYIAMEPFATSDFAAGTISDVGDNFKTIPSAGDSLVAAIQTFNGSNTAGLRKNNNQIKVEEEKSNDSETYHISEDIGYFTALEQYNVAVIRDEKPEGVIHNFSEKVRMGLTFYNYTEDSDIYNGEISDGGTFKLSIPQNPFIKNPSNYREIYTGIVADIDDIVDGIEHYPLVWGTTPIAENLHVVQNYFKQDDTFNFYGSYNNFYEVGNTYDPFYDNESDQKINCMKSFSIIFTDGEPYKDQNIPNYLVDYDEDSNLDDGSSTNNNNNYPDNLDDIAYWGYWDKDNNSYRDLRSDLDGEQYMSVYTAGFAGGSIAGILQDTADNAGGKAYSAASGEELINVFGNIFDDISKKVSAGSSVAVLTDKRKEGSIMTQAVFYPDYQGIPWIGKLFGYWFLNFKDPQGNAVQNIREDTIQDFKLNICDNGTPGGDQILSFGYDDISNKLSVTHSKSDCSGYDNGSVGNPYSTLEEINSLFEASDEINNDYSSPYYTDRNIYTPDDSDNLGELDDLNSANNFGSDLGCLGSFDNLTDFVYGKDIPGCVSRIDDDGIKRILGDIIYSTPRIANYDNMSMIYVGSNDGMLHAFRAGKTLEYSSSDYIAVQLQNAKNDNGTDEIGKEEWAFIPKNAQPYLRYRAQPEFKHLYINDLTPYIFDYGDKKILIGGMRMGGGVNCNNGNADCVSPPSDTISGHSSFYALDITDPLNPEYLWEFTDEYLGFAYSGPAVIKRNGKLYVMFLSGMKDYDGEVAYEGSNAKVYVLTLNTSNLNIEETNSYSVGNIDSSLKNNGVYGNRLFTDGVDLDNDGYTDAVFFAFSYLQSGDWTSSLYAARTDDGFFPSLNSFDKVMSSLHGAVTASIVYMPCFNMDYVYFGTGRWFYKEDDSAGRNNKLYGVNISCLRKKNCNFSSAVNNADICSDLQDNKQNKTAVAWEVGLNTSQVANGTNFGKERIISDAGKMEWANALIFTSMQPSTNPCAYGGRSRGWGLNCATGKSIWDASCSGYVVDNSSVTCGYLQTSTTAINQLCAESFSEQSGTRDVSNAMGNSDSSGGDSSVNDINAGQTEWHTGVTPETPPIIPSPYSGLKGEILLWIEK